MSCFREEGGGDTKIHNSPMDGSPTRYSAVQCMMQCNAI